MIIHSYRNTHEERFTQGSIRVLIAFILAAQDQGWLLDTSKTDVGVDIDTEGLTVYLVKTSDKVEVFPVNQVRAIATMNATLQGKVNNAAQDQS